MRLRYLFLLSLLFITGLAHRAAAQDKVIGQWRAHLPYNIVEGVASDGRTLYVAGEKSFFTYNALTGEYDLFSKGDGLHDINPTVIGWDAATSTAIIAYRNSNIDLYRNHSFTNIPDIKLRSFAGSKAVNNIYTDAGMAYLSTGLGVVVLNLSNPEVKETYVFSKGGQTLVNIAFTAAGQYFYAATSQGLYRAPRNSNALQAFSSWQAVDSVRRITGLASVHDQVFATGEDSLFAVTPNGLQFVYRSDTNTTHLDAGTNVAYLSVYYSNKGYGTIKVISPITLQVIDSFKAGHPTATAEAGGAPWAADLFNGLESFDANHFPERHVPNGPANYTAYDILPQNRDVWVAHGGFNEFYDGLADRTGFSHYSNDRWSSYQLGDSVSDVVGLAKDPGDGTLYAGTMGSGLCVVHPDGSTAVIKQGALNSPYGATSMAFDQGNNLWVTNNGATQQLAVRTPAGVWYHYGVQVNAQKPNNVTGLLVDDANQKWFFVPGNGGVVVYDDGGTPDNGADDRYFQYTVGSGNLPSDVIFSLAKDKEGSIWVGTSDGIGIISCGTDAVNGTCKAEKRVVQYDQFAGYLFQGEEVHAIAVDGANRKWIGTHNGVWLISPEGDKIISRFTADNSPLPSNTIQKISIDPITGDVYIGTDAGLVSYRGTATEGGTENASTILTFPNPVPSGYAGTVAIRGLVEDADVRITDISGQLIYRTKALGGQAVWNGLDYTGHRPQSGVLLIFASDKLGTQTTAGKIIYQH